MTSRNHSPFPLDLFPSISSSFLAPSAHQTKGLGSSVRLRSPPRPPSPMFPQQLLYTPLPQPALSPPRGRTPPASLVHILRTRGPALSQPPITPVPQACTFCYQLYHPHYCRQLTNTWANFPPFQLKHNCWMPGSGTGGKKECKGSFFLG